MPLFSVVRRSRIADLLVVASCHLLLLLNPCAGRDLKSTNLALIPDKNFDGDVNAIDLTALLGEGSIASTTAGELFQFAKSWKNPEAGIPYYYFFDDEPVPLHLSKEWIGAAFTPESSAQERIEVVDSIPGIGPWEDRYSGGPVSGHEILHLEPDLLMADVREILGLLAENPLVLLACPIFGPGMKSMVTDEFLASFDPSLSRAAIESFLDDQGVNLVTYRPGGYPAFLTLGTGLKEAVETISIANKIHNSTLTLYAHPNFIFFNVFGNKGK